MLALAARNGELDLRNQFLLRFITNFLSCEGLRKASARVPVASSQAKSILF
jgi:hypothetical protein